jgi:ABC-type polysaccharide/polyol phosphate export permease
MKNTADERFLEIYRRLIPSLLSRDLKVKYQRSLLGFVWTLINPILVSLILITVFSVVVRIPIESYWAFLLSGYFAWNFTQQCIGASSSIFQEHASLRRNVAFPVEILVLSAALSRLIEFLVELVVVVALICYMHHGSVPASIALLPVIILIQVFIALGIMFPISVLSVMFHDIQHAIPTITLILFYMSPILYPVSYVPDAAMPWYYINPLVIPLELFHQSIYEGHFPSLTLILSALGVSALFFSIGYFIFSVFKNECIETA